MKIVIDISEELYNLLPRVKNDGGLLNSIILRAVKNGKPIPKGHSRIIDASEVVKIYAFEKETNALRGDDDAFIEAIKKAHTIIEADKESEE